MIRPSSAATPGDIARHYDELDPFYRELWGEHLHHGYWQTGNESADEAVHRLVELVAARAGIGSETVVCDVGCGYGGTVRVLARDHGARVTGYTLSEAQRDIAARDDAGGNARFVLGDWLENDLAAESFDAIVAVESTEHMADKQRFFTEAARVLRPGGRLVVCAWLAAEDASSAARRHLLEPICVEGRIPSMGTPAEYRTMVEDAGLRVVSYEDITRHVRRTWRLGTRRILIRMLRPSAWRYLLDRRNQNRIFALTVPRIWAAYMVGAMRYGVFTAEKAPAGTHLPAAAGLTRRRADAENTPGGPIRGLDGR